MTKEKPLLACYKNLHYRYIWSDNDKGRAQYIDNVHTCSLCSTVPLQYVLLMLTGLKRKINLKCLNPIWIQTAWLRFLEYTYSYDVVMVSIWMVYWLIKATMRWYGSRAISIISLVLKSHHKGWRIKQASKKTDFTVDLIWWGSLKLTPITQFLRSVHSQRT